jgi:hypothetical protein
MIEYVVASILESPATVLVVVGIRPGLEVPFLFFPSLDDERTYCRLHCHES